MGLNYTIIYNSETALSQGLSVEARPSIPSAVANITEFEVPARDGTLHRIDGTVQDVEISIDFALANVPEDQWMTAYRRVTKWLYGNTDKRLILQDDLDWYYDVLNVEIGENLNRAHRMGGRFTAVFTVRGYAYLIAGTKPVTSYYNQYDISHPIYTISAESNVTLTVNGHAVTVNVGQGVTIDTDRMMTYRTSDGQMRNTALTGDYEDLWFHPGQNTISISSGAALSVIPQWRKRL